MTLPSQQNGNIDAFITALLRFSGYGHSAITLVPVVDVRVSDKEFGGLIKKRTN